MLFNKKNILISELEVVINSLRQKLHDAEAVIAEQKVKIDELSNGSKLEQGNSNQKNNISAKASSLSSNDAIVGLEDISKLLYEFVCADKEMRLDKHTEPTTILEVRGRHKARPDLQDDLMKIISGSGEKGLLVAQWKRKLTKSDENPLFSKMLPTFFNFLSKHWYIASRDTDKADIWKYANLKYNANAYAFLYRDILPKLVVEAESRKKELAVEAEKKRKEKEQKCIEKIQILETRLRERKVEVSEVAARAKYLIHKFGEKFLVEIWVELGGGTVNPPSASKYVRALTTKLLKHDDYDAEEVSDVRTVMYLTQEILPSLVTVDGILPPSGQSSIYFDRSRDWYDVDLSEIEFEIENIYQKFGRTREAIDAVNELQFIQQEILNRKKEVKAALLRQEKEENAEIEKQVKEIVDHVGEEVLVREWVKLGGGTHIPPSAENFITAIFENHTKLEGYDANIVKNIKAVRYLIDEILSPLALTHIEVQKRERRSKLEELRIKQKEISDNALRADWPIFIVDLEQQLKKHSLAFMRNYRIAYQSDEYGAVIKDDREPEIYRFLRSVKLNHRANKHGPEKTIRFVKPTFPKWTAA